MRCTATTTFPALPSSRTISALAQRAMRIWYEGLPRSLRGRSQQRRSTIGILPEGLGLDLSRAMNTSVYFRNGRLPAPWEMTISDAGGSRPVNAATVVTPAGHLLRQALESEQALSVRIRLDSGVVGGVELSFADVPLTIASLLASRRIGETVTLSIPLRCFADAGAEMSAVRNSVRITSEARLAITLIEARLTPAGTAGSCPAAVN